MRKNLVNKIVEMVAESMVESFWNGFQPRYESGRILFGRNGRVGIGSSYDGMKVQVTLPESVVKNMDKYMSKNWDCLNSRTETVKIDFPVLMVWGKGFDQRKFKVESSSIAVTYRADGIRLTIDMNRCQDCADESRHLILGNMDIFISNIQIRHNARKLMEHESNERRKESNKITPFTETVNE